MAGSLQLPGASGAGLVVAGLSQTLACCRPPPGRDFEHAPHQAATPCLLFTAAAALFERLAHPGSVMHDWRGSCDGRPDLCRTPAATACRQHASKLQQRNFEQTEKQLQLFLAMESQAPFTLNSHYFEGAAAAFEVRQQPLQHDFGAPRC